MAFKIKAPYHIDNTPIYRFEKEDGVLGRANKNGTVNIRCDMEPEQEKQVIAHELGHVDQFKEGRLDYFNDHIIWDGKKMARKNGKIKYEGKWHPEGWKGFPWESGADKAAKKHIKKMNKNGI